jgi:hypothetical protein
MKLAVIGLIGACLVPGIAWANHDRLFASIMLPSPSTACGVLVAEDVNHDFIADLVTACSDGAGLSVQLGLGGAHYAAPVRAPIGPGATKPVDLRLRDINHDGNLDAVTMDVTGNLSVHFGQGDGTFAAPVTTPAMGPRLAIGHVDADAEFDVAIASVRHISLLRGDGLGHFTFLSKLEMACCNEWCGNAVLQIELGDLNGDGLDDCVFVHETLGCASSRPLLSITGSDGVLGLPSTLADWGTNGVAIRDVDHDGSNDVVVTSNSERPTVVYYGKGLVRSEFTSLLVTTHVFEPAVLRVADVNGDGFEDILGVNERELRIGSYVAPRGLSEAAVYVAGAFPVSIDVADLDGDGIADIVTSNPASQSYTILLGAGGGAFQTPTTLIQGDPAAVAVADFNRDTYLDVAVAQRSFGFTVFHGNGAGGFTSSIPVQIFRPPWYLTAADFDADGWIDLVAVPENGRSIHVARNKGGTSYQLTTLAIDFIQARAPIVADVTGDGIPDIVVASQQTAFVLIFKGRGDGTFERHDIPVSNGPQFIDAGDFNGDGYIDLVVAYSGSVRIMRGAGGFGFNALAAVPGAVTPTRIRAVDLDADGRLDVVTSDYGGSVVVHRGMGDGTLAVAKAIPAGPQCRWFDVGHVDGDGRLDIVVPSMTLNAVTVLLGNGDGSLSQAGNYGVGGDATCAALGDFNGDQRLDVATSDFRGQSFSVLLNQTPVSTASAGGGDPRMPARSSLAIEHLVMRRAGRESEVTCRLAPDRRAILEWVDVAGRVGTRSRLEPTGTPRTTARIRWPQGGSGVYWLRLSQDGIAVARKAVILE